MSGITGSRLWTCLTQPEALAQLTGDDGADLLNLAWRQGVIFRLAHLAKEAGILPKLPSQIAGALADFAIEADYNARQLSWEINRVAAALQSCEYPVLLLKGGAYQAAGFSFAHGRYSSDLDILVPKAHVEHCEALLQASGWASEIKSAYDEQYYRQWMHELPPLRHKTRQTIVDLHHNILPPVSRISPDIDAVFEHAVEVSDWPLKRPSLPDLFVHSALHSFYDGDFTSNVRNMLDLRDLYQLGTEAAEDFEAQLLARADRHGAQMPVADALRTLKALGAIELGSTGSAFVERHRRSMPVQAYFNWCVDQRTRSPQPFGRGEAFLARQSLYIRSHWITMPPTMLAKHLGRKAVMRLRGKA